MATHTFRFSINTWQHLYSLTQAVQQSDSLTGNHLVIAGVIRNDALFKHRDKPVRITLSASPTPHYLHTDDHRVILGQLSGTETLVADIPVDPQVFSELKKNLVEYIGIEGIHIVITLGIALPGDDWPGTHTASIVQLDYAMKGEGA